MMSVAVLEVGVVFVEPEVKSQWWTALVVYLILSQMLDVIKHVVDDNIIHLSATQHTDHAMHAPANWCEQHSSTAAVQNC